MNRINDFVRSLGKRIIVVLRRKAVTETPQVSDVVQRMLHIPRNIELMAARGTKEGSNPLFAVIEVSDDASAVVRFTRDGDELDYAAHTLPSLTQSAINNIFLYGLKQLFSDAKIPLRPKNYAQGWEHTHLPTVYAALEEAWTRTHPLAESWLRMTQRLLVGDDCPVAEIHLRLEALAEENGIEIETLNRRIAARAAKLEAKSAALAEELVAEFA